MHSPPWETMGDAVTRCSVMRPSSPIAHRRWKNISKRIGSIDSCRLLMLDSTPLKFLHALLDLLQQRVVDEVFRLELLRLRLLLAQEIEHDLNAFQGRVRRCLEERQTDGIAVIEHDRIVDAHVFG